MKKNAKQTLAELKTQAISTEDLARRLAQWDENSEMSEEIKQKVFGGSTSPNPAGDVTEILGDTWFLDHPVRYALDLLDKTAFDCVRKQGFICA